MRRVFFLIPRLFVSAEPSLRHQARLSPLPTDEFPLGELISCGLYEPRIFILLF